ncbi:MAG: hypothetical protein OXU77_07435 [Gammaproteobacteria bacterium]|nr:hypothetical protein [Gammaproteobacteria bacterium]MDE0443705.1 hypothetical protein [Gammaproteobacteria bacterium]
MKRVAVVVAVLVIVLYVIAIVLPIDPVERRPGTGLSGTLAVDQDTDWAFIKGRTRAWVETRTRYLVPHSITVSAWADDGKLYVGCRECDTKVWPRNVARDDRVRIKIGDSIYERRAVRITDPEQRAAVLGPGAGRPGFAVFRMDAR